MNAHSTKPSLSPLFVSTLILAALAFPAAASAQQFIQSGPKLVAPGAVGASLQGRSVAMSGDGYTAIVGGPQDSSETGAAWVLTLETSNSWIPEKLIGSNGTGALQGISVALSADGSTAAVGGPTGDRALRHQRHAWRGPAEGPVHPL
jgi:hypothetical protein